MAANDEPSEAQAGLARRAVLGIAGASVLAFSAAPSLARDRAGSVEEMWGEAFAEADKQRRRLETAAPVFIADDVSTGSGSRLSIRLGRDTVVRLGELARLTIDRFIENAGGVLTLNAGPLLFDKPSGSSPRPLNIRSSFGLIAVRGTNFFAGPSNGVFGVFVARGRVEVSAAGRQVVLVDAQGTDIRRPGEPPTAPAFWKPPRIEAAMASVL
jgi:hypothetical protein